MIEYTRWGNGIFSVAEMHLSFPQEQPDQGLMVECQRCYSQRIIKEREQGRVDQQQGEREEACT